MLCNLFAHHCFSSQLKPRRCQAVARHLHNNNAAGVGDSHFKMLKTRQGWNLFNVAWKAGFKKGPFIDPVFSHFNRLS